MKNEIFRVCVLTQPLPLVQGGNPLLIDLLKVLRPISSGLTLISSNFPRNLSREFNVHFKDIGGDNKQQLIFIRIIKHIATQGKIFFAVIQERRNFDVIISYVGGKMFTPALLIAKMMGKKLVVIVTGSAKDAEQIYGRALWGLGRYLLSWMSLLFEMASYSLADGIVAETKSIANLGELKKYQRKIHLSGVFFNTAEFIKKTSLGKRKKVVGYVGRLSEEKGIMNLVAAIPLVIKKDSSIRFTIVGTGKLSENISAALTDAVVGEYVNLIGWVAHNSLFKYYNEMTLLVVPSFFESVPIVAMEAMACGTPVLATPVGGIPDIIQHRKNGYLLASNEPEVIAESIMNVLDDPLLEKVSETAEETVTREYSYGAASIKYKLILNSLFE
jgi:glycosyltransferase involved in cell wall biosynthesis